LLKKPLGSEETPLQQSSVPAAARALLMPSAPSNKAVMSFKSLNVLGGAGQ